MARVRLLNLLFFLLIVLGHHGHHLDHLHQNPLRSVFHVQWEGVSILHDLMSRHRQWYLLLLWRTQSRNNREASSTVEPVFQQVFVSDVLRQALFGATKFGMRQGITIPQEDPTSPFSMASSNHFIHDPSGCKFNAGFGWLNRWGF